MENYNYWLDLIDYYKDYLSTKRWLLIYFYINGSQINFPDVRFWCITILAIGMGLKIYDNKNGLWTVKGCFQEIEELLEKERF